MSINNFGPFASDVWGTVSDWAMVIVTVITALYLYKNFQSQLKITRIEESKYKLSIMPLFDINILPESSLRLLEDKFILTISLEIKLVNENVARQFFMWLPNNSDWEYSIPNQNIKKNFRPNDSFLFNATKEATIIYIDGAPTEFFMLDFNVEFTDDVNNPYRQKVNYNRLKGFERISISYPELTEN